MMNDDILCITISSNTHPSFLGVVASMYLTVSAIVDLSSASLFVIAPIVVVQKAKLRKLGTLRQAQNDLRAQVNRLSMEIENLKLQNIELDLQTTELSKVTGEYKKFAKARGAQVDRLLSIVEENGAIQAKIKRNLESQVMQQALDTILKCDTDEDFSISQKEIPQMQLRLSRIKGVEFDKRNFDKLFKKNKGELHLKEIMAMFRNLKDDIPEEENIFHLKPEKLAPTTPRSRNVFGF